MNPIVSHKFRELLKIASHVGWVKPRKRRTQHNFARSEIGRTQCARRASHKDVASQNHIVRRVSLRSTHPTFELLEVPFNLSSSWERGFQTVAIVAALLGLPACVSVNTFPMVARAGDTVSVMVGGSEKASRETISATLRDINGQTWDLKALGLVRSVFNLRTDGRAYGAHYSSYSEMAFPWAYGHEPLQTVFVTDLPVGVALGQASLSVNLNTNDNSSGVASPFTVNLEIIAGTGSADSFLRRSALGTKPVDFAKMEPAPNAKISFGSGATAIGAASLVVDFDETVVNPDDLNVFSPESAVRGTSTVPGAFGKTQRMIYWRQDGQKLYLDVVAPQGIEPKYLKLHVVHPRGVSGSPAFNLLSATVYGVDGAAIAVQPTLEYFP